MNAPDRHAAVISVPAGHFIDNRFVPAADARMLAMIDPSDGAPFAAIARGTAADVDLAVQAAQRARAGTWGRLAPAERGRRLMALSNAIREHADELARIEARD
ncbi:MAG TPA: aldehyde dehydrogenase family protein, partial [Casimicrobiaceae bacterium]|nr:aldehyde dehydrogenase family protein [Casimicrobiaceae bacterium]